MSFEQLLGPASSLASMLSAISPFGASLLDLLFMLATLTTLMMFLFGGLRIFWHAATLAYAAMFVVIIGLGGTLANGADSIPSAVAFSAFGEYITWRIDGLGWYFAMLTAAFAFFSAIFASGRWGAEQTGMRMQNGLLAFNVLAMFVLLSSGDLLSLFISWEILSWAAYAMMTQAGGAAARAAYRYLIYALAGAMMLLAAILMVRAETGAMGYSDLAAFVAHATPSQLWILFALFAAGFGIKMGIMPFHLWQAEAYAYTPGASATFLNAIAGRMGLFAIVLVIVKLVSVGALARLSIPFTWFDAHTLFLWIAAITVVVPTFIALMQTDARMLLAWHGIGQGGYMLLGVLLATPLGAAGGLFHVLTHGTYQAALFFAVTAVVFRTRTSDLDELGGLINRMPFTYITLLIGIIGLAGLPPINGFVSKWMIYKALLIDERPLLLVMAVIGTLGTILSVYKLIHNIFLGQLRAEHQHVKEAPLTMLIPMLSLAMIAFITGVFPGLALAMVDAAQSAAGVPLQPHHLGGVPLGSGGLDMRWVVGVLVFMIGMGAFIFYVFGNKRRAVHQFDNYAGGHFLSADIRYHYSHEFYPGLARQIGPLYRGSIANLEKGLIQAAKVGGDFWIGVFRAAHTPLYAVIAVIAGLIWAGVAGGY